MEHCYCCRFSIAGVSFQLNTQSTIALLSAFQGFPAKADDPTWTVDYSIVEQLPPMHDRPVFEDFEHVVCRDSDSTLKVFFRDPAKENVIYAVTQVDYEKRCSTVHYLPTAKASFDGIRNTFFHSLWERLLLEDGRMILHASLVSSTYGGILFSGVSGIGKSTQADLWAKYANADVLNGDRPVLACREGVWTGFGSPYAGSSGIYRNESCPLCAIVLLQQAKSCTIQRLGLADAFRGVFAGITVNSGDPVAMGKACDLVQQLVQVVPVYRMSCTPDEAAVELLKKTLEGADDDATDTSC